MNRAWEGQGVREGWGGVGGLRWGTEWRDMGEGGVCRYMGQRGCPWGKLGHRWDRVWER